MTEKEWIKKVAPYAVNAARLYHFPASLLIAMTCREMGYGSGDNCEVLVKCGNIIGMKKELLNSTWKSLWWTGGFIIKKTPEYANGKLYYKNDSFRSYAAGSDNGFQDCLNDFCQFMQDARYSVGGKYKYRDVLSMESLAAIILTVSTRGWCTDPNYAPAIMDIVRKHDLTQYDVDIPVKAPVIIANKNFGLHNTYERNTGIKYLAMHYVGATGTAPNNVEWYNTPSVGTSADFFVDFDGKAYGYNMDIQNRACKAVGGDKQSSYGGTLHKVATNYNCINVEMCVRNKGNQDAGSPDWYFEDATVEGAAQLAAYLLYKYAIPIDRLIRHYDINGKYCPGVTGWIAPMGGEAKWNAFKERVKQIMANNHTVIRNGSTGEEVREWQKFLLDIGCVDCIFNESNFVTGNFNSTTEKYTRLFQKAFGLSVDGVVGTGETWPKADAIMATLNTSKVDFTVEQLMAAAKARTKYYKANGYVWNSSTIAPWLDRSQKYTSCDRSVDDYFNDCGLSVGNRNAVELKAYLLSIGGTLITNVNQVKAGDVVFVNNMGHVFLCAGKNLRYDCGSTERIQLKAQYSHYSEQPFNEPITGFHSAVRLPFKESTTTPTEDEYTTSDKKYSLVIEQVRKGSYNPYVGLLQSRLTVLGYYEDTVDNDFGDNTYKALVAYQAAEIAKGNNIGGSDGKPDGICGKDTWSTILGIDVKAI